MTVSEMLTAETSLWHTQKSRYRQAQVLENEPHAVQIAGSKPEQMADAARQCVDQGAMIIDINMGCPAKKVCNALAGSALLKDEKLVTRILNAVVGAVPVPVTLKIRTGWDRTNKNAITVADIAENCGIQALTIHGRTRADRFSGAAEYETIRQVKSRIKIPVFANGDIDSPEKAKTVLEYTLADGLYIGRASQGRPWLFKEISHYLATSEKLPAITPRQKREIILEHLQAIYSFYGDQQGVRIARKHLSWYLKSENLVSWRQLSQLESAACQYDLTSRILHNNEINREPAECILNQNNLAA